MTVLGALAVALDIPDLAQGIRFYTDAGLELVESDGQMASLRCPGRQAAAVLLRGGAAAKRLHHISLRTDGLEAIARLVPQHGGQIVPQPEGWGALFAEGLWLRDPHGMLIHLVDAPAEAPLEPGEPFAVNAPGRVVRNRRSAMLAGRLYPPVRPLRLGHVLVFSPDVLASVDFMTQALGMGLADRAQDVIAFCCARKDSDHHVVAFAKAGAIGFHHASFQVSDPDEVGRGGRALLARAGKGDWGFGRHTIGSNVFHYIQDPWGSWFEYYADMDYIDDYALWSPTNYALEDSLANWGPPVPHDFVHNYEADALLL
ncbi:VOC family protein [Novosphingobium terrae]|uniref:VOC family protein n=1 Tax=Novosphingobium terrae TaxID=2726189 RepID=UPI001980359F|nr:VOC family protein [Novosphingobium terrae]